MLVGPTRLGKTEWARSIGRHIYMCGLFNVDMWDAQAKYIVIDDISFDFMGGARKSLWGGQKEFTVTGKYRKNRTVKWGKPMIFLCNQANDFRYLLNARGNGLYLENSEKEWYIANSVIVDITTPMF